MRKIYFAASITAGRDDQPTYEVIVRELEKYGTVLTELIGSPNLSAMGEEFSQKEIHDRDVSWLLESDCVVAEVTTPSLGVGYEIATAFLNQIPILCLFRSSTNRRLSAMVAGCSGATVKYYEINDQIPELIQEFFQTLATIPGELVAPSIRA